MNEEIFIRLKTLHAEYSELQEMQLQLPFRRSRNANHEDTEKKISGAAYILSRKIEEFKVFCRNHPSYDINIAMILNKNKEIDNMAYGVQAIIFNPYRRF